MLRVFFCLIVIHISSLASAEEPAQYVSIEQLMGTIDDVNRANVEKIPCPQGEVVAVISTASKPPTPEKKEVEAISGEKLQLSVLSEAEAKAIFDRLKDRTSGLDRNCLCRQIAHYSTRFMEDQGIIAGKLFVKPNWEGYWGNKIRPQVPGNRDEGVGWNFHVAPLIYVRKGDVVEQYILDPALFSEPVPVAKWRAALGNSAEPSLTSRFVYGTQQVFDTPRGYIPSEVKQANDAISARRCIEQP